MKRIILSLVLICVTLLCNASGGPYPMYYDAPIDDNECKLVVPTNQGGSVVIKNMSTNESYTIHASVTYFDVWYYVIPKGVYKVISILEGYNVTAQGVNVTVGDTIDYSYGGYINFSRTS